MADRRREPPASSDSTAPAPGTPPSERGRRALSNVGGKARLTGDRRIAERLAHAATPDPEDDGRTLTHRFHAWPARMHPHTARELVRGFSAGSHEGLVLDPFMGGGTVVVEALVAGREAAAADINPVALEVAWGRTRRWSEGQLEALGEAAARAVAGARALRAEGEVPEALRRQEGRWYDPPALAEVWSLAEACSSEAHPELRRMLLVTLSSILVKASRQRSDSVHERDPDHRWVPAGRVEGWFIARVREHRRSIEALRAVVSADTPEPRLGVGDARELPRSLDGRVGLVLTSPPYPGVYDYVDHHRRRYAALRLDASGAERGEIGARRHGDKKGWMSVGWRFEQDLAAALQAWRRALRPRGRIVMVLGDGEHPERVIRVEPLVARAAASAGLEVLATVSQARPMFGPARFGPDQAREEHVFALGEAT